MARHHTKRRTTYRSPRGPYNNRGVSHAGAAPALLRFVERAARQNIRNSFATLEGTTAAGLRIEPRNRPAIVKPTIRE